jgi:hypothetical protein
MDHITIELHGTQGVAETTVQNLVKKITDCIKKQGGIFASATTLISRVPTTLTPLAECGNGKHQSLFMVRIYAPRQYGRKTFDSFLNVFKKTFSKDIEYVELILH